MIFLKPANRNQLAKHQELQVTNHSQFGFESADVVLGRHSLYFMLGVLEAVVGHCLDQAMSDPLVLDRHYNFLHLVLWH